METRDVDMSLIDLPEFDHRLTIDPDRVREMADSVDAVGQLTAIIIKHKGTRFEVVAGGMRYRAFQLLKRLAIRADIYEEHVNFDPEAIKTVENLQRSNLTPIEEARSLAYMRDTQNKTIEAIARSIGRRREWVDDRLALLELPDDIGELLHSKALPIATANELARCTDPAHRAYLTQHAINSGATAQLCRQWVTTWVIDLQSAAQQGVPPPPIDFTQAPPELSCECFMCTASHKLSQMRVVRICGDCSATIKATQH